MDYRVEIPSAIDKDVLLPLSKSIVARVLIINALTRGADLPANVPCCDDSEVLIEALASDDDHIDVGAAGTAMRFLTAYYACQEGRTVTLDGTERMRQRPVGPLVDALRQMGASIEYLGDEGRPPLKIEGRKLHGGALTMRGDVSSQFVSALLMIAPVVGGITLTLEGEIVSRPYIDMTISLMRCQGIEAKVSATEKRQAASSPSKIEEVGGSKKNVLQIVVPAGHYVPTPINIEGDWSAASYWFALKALLPQSHISLSPLHQDSIQGDRTVVEMMAPLGVDARFLEDDEVVLSSDEENLLPDFYERDMAATPDLVPTLVVTLCLLRVPFTLTGVATLRLKESDRLESLREELSQLGYSIDVNYSSLSYNGNYTEIEGEVTLSPHGDHRLAMALSLAATRHKIVIKNAEVVNKSYPGWWQQLINA